MTQESRPRRRFARSPSVSDLPVFAGTDTLDHKVLGPPEPSSPSLADPSALVSSAISELAQGIRAPRPRANHAVLDLDGVEISSATEADVVKSIIAALEGGHGGWVLTPNVDQLRRISREQEIEALLRDVDLAVADGMPLVWASRLRGEPLPERVAGSNLVWSLSAAAAASGRSIFLLGGDDGVAGRAADIFQGRWPMLRIAGTCCPRLGFGRRPEEIAAIRAALEEAQPDIVYVALGFPKQERLIAELRDVLPHAWFLGVGISLSFVTGDSPRAPRWMHRLGLEWSHRLLVEPRRLFRRYVVEDIPFVVSLLLRAAIAGVRRRLQTA